MANKYIPVSPRTIAALFSNGSRQVRFVWIAIFGIADQSCPAKNVGLYWSVRGTSDFLLPPQPINEINMINTV